MTPKFPKYVTIATSVVASGALVVIWWINGAKRADIWFYLAMTLIVLSATYSAYPRKKKDHDQQ